MYLHRARHSRPCALALLSALSACIPGSFPGQESSSSDLTTETESGESTTPGETDTTAGPLPCGNGKCDPGESPQNCMDDCVAPPTCGDGVKDGAPEECDQGAANSDKGACTTQCKQAFCGDGFVQTGVEACDDGNKVDDDACSNACALKDCGDGMIQPGEQCDDGNAIETDACTSLCLLARCGDGHTQPDAAEECDLGLDNADDQACTTTCKSARCGDGHVQIDVEACDDGNEDDDDSCVSCVVAFCGDGFVESGVELCDDANLVNDDTCSNDCEPPRRVFVTSLGYQGDLGGLAGADKTCKTHAGIAKLPGTFRAWLSDDTGDPMGRFDKAFTGSYQLVDNTVVANGWADLIDGTLAHPIDLDEQNTKTVANVWTNTLVNGQPPMNGKHCTNWTSNANNVNNTPTYGASDAADLTWTQFATVGCAAMNRLYCFENP